MLAVGMTGCGESYSEVGIPAVERAAQVENEEMMVLCDRWVGDFHHQLTDEQIEAIFSNVEWEINAIASYYQNGELVELEATFQPPNSYRELTVRVAERELYPWCGFLESVEPIILDIQGVEVLFHPGYARFILDGVDYIMRLHRESFENGQLSEMEEALINQIISGAPADLSILADPEIPEIWTAELTFEEALNDPEFGRYLPQVVPTGFDFESAWRSVNQFDNNLGVSWRYDDLIGIWWMAVNTEHWDMDFMWRYNQPFLPEELTFEVIEQLARYIDWEDIGTKADGSAWLIYFNIYHNEILVQVHMTGVTPYEAWEMVQSMEIMEGVEPILNGNGQPDTNSEKDDVFADRVEVVDEHVFATIYNDGSFNVMVGLEFQLERYEAGNWVIVPRAIPYDSAEFAITIDPEDHVRVGWWLEPFMPLSNGHYRMRKPVWNEADWMENNHVTPLYELIVEFEW